MIHPQPTTALLLLTDSARGPTHRPVSRLIDRALSLALVAKLRLSGLLARRARPINATDGPIRECELPRRAKRATTPRPASRRTGACAKG